MATERTHLANERTLLAYIRTALALAGAGAVLLQFFPAYPMLSWCAWLSGPRGRRHDVVGIYRFVIVRGRLRE